MKNKNSVPYMFPDSLYGKMGIDPIIADPYGSYTGVPREPDEIPVQDADDL